MDAKVSFDVRLINKAPDLSPFRGFLTQFLDALMRTWFVIVPVWAQAPKRYNVLMPDTGADDLLTPVTEPFG